VLFFSHEHPGLVHPFGDLRALERGSSFLFFRFFVLDAYDGTGERIDIDLGDVF
jgi:hypothetical protein